VRRGTAAPLRVGSLRAVNWPHERLGPVLFAPVVIPDTVQFVGHLAGEPRECDESDIGRLDELVALVVGWVGCGDSVACSHTVNLPVSQCEE